MNPLLVKEKKTTAHAATNKNIIEYINYSVINIGI